GADHLPPKGMIPVSTESSSRTEPHPEQGDRWGPDGLRQHRGHPALAAIQAAIALGAATLATIGIWFRGAAGTRVIEGLHGPAEVVTGGLYAGNSAAVVAEGVGWDVVTLALAAPLLLGLAVVGARTDGVTRRGSRIALAAAGLLFYVLYQYHQYAITYAFGPLLPAFIVLAASALICLLLTLGSLPPLRPTPRYPRRTLIAIMALVPLALTGMWAGRIFAALTDPAARAETLQHYTTLPVQVMDLVWLVPLGGLFAVLLARRHPIGYLGATILAVKGATMAFAIVAMVIGTAGATGELEIPGLVMFLAVGMACTYAAVRGILALEPVTTGASGKTPPRAGGIDHWGTPSSS
ncbi:MAG: hypothetical protein Q4G64_09720, partial [bacterium]|nr:hypothetical protein [bacterium]